MKNNHANTHLTIYRTRQPKYPGAADRIINLGSYLNQERLKKHKDEIVNLTNDKQACYRKGYSFLSAAGKIKKEITCLVKNDFQYDKMNGAVERFFHQQDYKGDAFESKIRLVETVSSNGIERLNSFEEKSDKICCIINGHGLEYILLDEFMNVSKKRNLSVYKSFDVCTTDDLNALYYPKLKLSAVKARGDEDLYQEKYKVFNMERFISKKVLNSNRVKLRFSNKCFMSLVKGATDSFAEAKVLHEKIEAIYRDSVDFGAVNEERIKVCKEINQILTL